MGGIGEDKMKDALFGEYIARNYTGNNLTDRELRVLRNGDVELMVSTFVKMKNERYVQQLQCAMKAFSRHLGEGVVLNRITAKKNVQGKFLCCQTIDGDMDVFFGVTGDDQAMITLASRFAEEEFDVFDEDAYDSACEMVNWINGEFATKLGEDDIEVSLYPPVFYSDAEVCCDKEFYDVSLTVDGMELDLIMAVDERLDVISYEKTI